MRLQTGSFSYWQKRVVAECGLREDAFACFSRYIFVIYIRVTQWQKANAATIFTVPFLLVSIEKGLLDLSKKMKIIIEYQNIVLFRVELYFMCLQILYLIGK